MNITPGQRRFLLSYLDEISSEVETGTRSEFVERVIRMDFDDGSAASPSARMIATKLRETGLLSELEIHNGHIWLMFSKAGAETLFDIYYKYVEDRI